MADKHVKDEKIHASFDKLNPTAEQSGRMWERLSAAMEVSGNMHQEDDGKTVDIKQAKKTQLLNMKLLKKS